MSSRRCLLVFLVVGSMPENLPADGVIAIVDLGQETAISYAIAKN